MEDALYPLLKFYKQVPPTIQDAVGFAYRTLPNRFRFGTFYDEYRKRISLFLESDPAMVRQLQLGLLLETVNRAISYVPYYASMPRIESFEEFRGFPVVSKSEIIDNASAFVSTEFSSKRLKANTGGSSGTPMEFNIHAGKTRPKERAHFDWFWGQCGYAPGERVLMIRGAPLTGNALYEYQSIKNCLAVSCYELNSSNIEEVLREARRFRPQFIHGYPSAVKNFIQCIAENPAACWDLPLRGIFLGSEGLSAGDRAEIGEFLGAQILAWYGHSECAIMGGNSPHSSELYFFPFYGYAELLNEDGKPIHRPGEIGRLVATSFDNFVMPFIRYDTGDYGELSSTDSFRSLPCFVLSKIEGRGQDIIHLCDGTRVSLTAFIFGQHLPEFSRIREMQLVQDVGGELLLRIVRGKDY
ncbi:MAG: hypothetical protein RBS57_10755, partial [Desulforhabdus sp.]|nr:hypothetical protein [Desulforhabdus sp.]